MPTETKEEEKKYARHVSKRKCIKSFYGERYSNIETPVKNFINEIQNINPGVEFNVEYHTMPGNSGGFVHADLIWYEYVDEKETICTPHRKFEILKLQDLVDDAITEIRKLFDSWEKSGYQYDHHIEEFKIYDDATSRDRDHHILIYSYTVYEPI